MTKLLTKIDIAKKRGCDFTLRLMAQRKPGKALPPDTQSAVLSLCLAAFALYQLEWSGQDIRNWTWPFDQLSEGRPFTENGEPWTVLLREAHRTVTE